MKKVIRGKIPLLTSNGKTIVPIEITYDDTFTPYVTEIVIPDEI